jgi:hypothetical protein
MNRFYASYRWKHKTSPLVRHYNPICQFIDHEGTQCRAPSEIVHHLIAPEDCPEKAHDWSNLVALCLNHYHPGKGDRDKGRYVATLGPNGAVYDHANGLPDWKRGGKPRQDDRLPAPGGDPAGDFAMTVQALERGLPAEAMTARAVRRALQETVRAGEGAGRNLCQSGRGAQQEGRNTGQAQHGQDAKERAAQDGSGAPI